MDEILKAKKEGKDISQIRKTDEKNKDLAKMLDIFSKLPSPAMLIKDVNDEQDLKEKLRKLYKTEGDARLAYKLLAYVFATNHSTIRKLGHLEEVEF